MVLTKCKHKKEAHKRWKQQQVTHVEYRDTVGVCGEGVSKAKAHLESNLVRVVKGFYRSMSSKRETGPAAEGDRGSSYWCPMEGQEHKWKYRKFHLNVRNTFFYSTSV